jgi:predicted HTH domain antitoxin
MQIAINLPNDFVNFQLTTDIEKELRQSYSLWLLRNTRVTLLKATELAGMNIYDYLAVCKQNDVPVIDISREELQAELIGIVDL